MAITVIENETEQPEPEELSELDDTIVSRFGWAFRFGMGPSDSLNDFRYGYIIGGTVLNPDTIPDFEQKIQQETQLNNPTVLFKSVTLGNNTFDSMKKLGKLPHESLSSLNDLLDELEETDSL